MIDIPATGTCQCKACEIQVTLPGFVAYTCHCRACQRLSSSAFTTCLQAPAEGVGVSKGESATFKRPTDTGNTLSVTYCPHCATALFGQNTARPRIRTVFAGCLEQVGTLPVNAHIWVKYKLPWVRLPDDHRIFEEGGDWRADYAHDLSRLLPDLS